MQTLAAPSSAQQRRLAVVQARLAGASLRAAAAAAGVSLPTALKAWQRYLAGGLDALAERKRGRPAGPGANADAVALALATVLRQPPSGGTWSLSACRRWLQAQDLKLSLRSLQRLLAEWGLNGAPLRDEALQEAWQRSAALGPRRRLLLLQEGPWPAAWAALADSHRRGGLLLASDRRGHCRWLPWQGRLRAPQLIDFVSRLRADETTPGRPLVLLLAAPWQRAAAFADWLRQQPALLVLHLPAPVATASAALRPPRAPLPTPAAEASQPPARLSPGFGLLYKQFTAQSLTASATYADTPTTATPPAMSTDHLDRLEAEAIHIFREVVAEADKPVLLYSIGKDSAALLHVALKAFYPGRLPMPLLHVDTGWKFRAMYAHRDRIAREAGIDLIVHRNADGIARGINPFDHGASLHTDIMKTQALKQALDLHGFDVAFGGARRDEEKSRAKERVLSLRNAQHRWDPKNQRPELWRLYNGRKRKGESLRAFPLSNWTEADIWQYIRREGIELVPLYFAAERPVVERDGVLIMVDDERMPLHPGEVPVMRKVRFRTLGCYPLTGAIESAAADLDAVIAETLATRQSERSGRVIDHDASASMEKKKQEGYF